METTRATIYEVNNPNSFDFFVGDDAAAGAVPEMDDFDNFDFFDGFEFDDHHPNPNHPHQECKRSNTPEHVHHAQQQAMINEVYANEFAQEQQEQAKLLLGIYSQEERDKLLEAYREKRKRRVYGKVRYVLRQKVSENRPRVKGRFVTREEATAPPPAPTAASTTVGGEEDRPRKRSSVISVFKNWSLSSPFAASPSQTTQVNTPNASPFKRSSLPPLRPLGSSSSSHSANSTGATTTELWSEKLMELRNKKRNNSTTAASTESHKAKREVPFVKPPTTNTTGSSGSYIL
ncbi:hypothetical protein BASA81_007569 [Batrachochytrium salamandrivorans]|nr:hypothetical protein BASA81_007569 [Batrachochytrium salamandrivorans]